MATRPLSSLQFWICLLVFALASTPACVLAGENVIRFADSAVEPTTSNASKEQAADTVAEPTESNGSTEQNSAVVPSSERLSQELGEKEIGEISVSEARPARGERVPDDAFEQAIGKQGMEACYAPAARGFDHHHYHWKASGLLHKPLYFEDVSLERYGQTHILQPAVSGLKFFATVPILPYKIGVDRCRCIYTLGYQRPGNCACPVTEYFPLSLKGAALEAGALTGFVFLFP